MIAAASSLSPSRSTPPARSGRRGPPSSTSTTATSRGRRPATARRQRATISSSAGRSGSSATSSSAAPSPCRRPVLVPPRGGGAAEPPGLAARAPVLAARRVGRGRLGVQPDRPALVRRSRARWRAGGCGRSALSRAAALVGGLVFCLMPYRVGQSTGHLLGLIAFLLPAMLLALERRRFVGRRRLSGGDPALGPAPPRAGGDPARARLRVGAHAAGRLVEGGQSVPRPRSARVWSSTAGPSRARSAPAARSPRSTGTRPSSPTSSRAGVGSGHRGARVRRLADAARRRSRASGAIRRRRGLAVAARAGGAPPVPARPRRQPAAATSRSGAHVPGLDATRVPERFMPIACLAIAALVAFAVDVGPDDHSCRVATGSSCRSPSRVSPCCWRSTSACRCSAPSRPTTPSAAYAAIRGDGRLLELPVFRPDVHYGSVYLALCAAEPARAAAGLLDDRTETRRRTGARAASALLRPRNRARRPRRSLRRRAPRPLRAERLLRGRLS